MTNSLFFKIKDTVDVDNHRIIELFFKDWVDSHCQNQVRYKVANNHLNHNKIVRVDFDKQEDATALKLRGIPGEFQWYMELIN
jgi:hypothetical protein